jgi:hypothetical protein
VSGSIVVKITSLAYESIDEIFQLRGGFEADGTAEANIASVTADSGTEWVQDYADATGSFLVTFWPDIEAEPFGVTVDDPILDDLD